LQIDFQIEEYPEHQGTASNLVIHGISFDQMRSSDVLVGKIIEVYGGMHPAPALPLSIKQSAHNGLLMRGQIIRTFGTWIGTEMSIGLTFKPAAFDPNNPDFSNPSVVFGQTGGTQNQQAGTQQFNRVGPRSIFSRPFATASTSGVTTTTTPDAPNILPTNSVVNSMFLSGPGAGAATFAVPGGGTGTFWSGGMVNPLGAPLNLMHNLQPGQELASAIEETLRRAFPHSGLWIGIASGLTRPEQDSATFQNMEQYSSHIHDMSVSMKGSTNYLGVMMSGYDNTIRVYDATHVFQTHDVEWLDLIGQPSWIDPATLGIKTVLRGDVHVSDLVKLDPNTMTTGILAEFGSPPQKTTISVGGFFLVVRVYHIGDFRNPDGSNWSTMIHAVPMSLVMPDWMPSQPIATPTIVPPGGGNSSPASPDTVPPQGTPNVNMVTPQRSRTMLRAVGR
jgi:hypothetical protein